jgi:AcrR family transcriptional regulator
MSIRNESSDTLPSTITDRVLDAARSCLVRAGGGKITLAEVARVAGVSRPTVYRRWPDVQSVTGELVTREMAALVTAIPVRGVTLADQVDRLVAVADSIRRNDLFDVLWREPSTALAPYVFVRLGKSHRRRAAAWRCPAGPARSARRHGAADLPVGDPIACDRRTHPG